MIILPSGCFLTARIFHTANVWARPQVRPPSRPGFGDRRDGQKEVSRTREETAMVTTTPADRASEHGSRPAVTARRPPGRRPGTALASWLSTTDHKIVGKLYLYTSLAFFLLAGLMALIIRAELFAPGLQVVQDYNQYNQLFTIHGTVMLLLFATPMFSAFANLLVPLQIGSPDVAFPRLNMFSYWLFLFGGLFVVSAFLTPEGAAAFGWYAYQPLANSTFSPGLGGTLWVTGLLMTGFSTILGTVNFMTTILCLRAPGMTMWRMPIFTWNILLTGILVLLAFPILATGLFGVLVDRQVHGLIFEPQNGGAILWQHLFWFFGHPEVYIVALPFFGIITEIIPVFSRKPIFGYRALVFATIAITGLSAAVWGHHMYSTGYASLPFFSFMSMLIAVPTGIKFFNWIGTMWRGQVTFASPMLFALGFLATFLFGGLTGVILASPPLDWHVTDSYFVVAHFHYVLFGTVVFATFGGIYFWWPKWTGRFLGETLARWHFWLTFIGFHTTFLVQHWLGVQGMPRRYADYLPQDGFTTGNQISTAGSFILGASMIVFTANVVHTAHQPRRPLPDDPWGNGRSLEWATSCPPPRHNFTQLPRIRSESPAFDLHHPEAAAAEVQLPHRDDPASLALGDSERPARPARAPRQGPERGSSGGG
jgi:cytochrome c oxidase subunit 1